jgi:hypothetical protein
MRRFPSAVLRRLLRAGPNRRPRAKNKRRRKERRAYRFSFHCSPFLNEIAAEPAARNLSILLFY